MIGRTWTEPEDELLKKLWFEVLVKEICSKLKRCDTSVYYRAKQLGLDKEFPFDEERFSELYSAGLTDKELARELGVKSFVVARYRRLKRLYANTGKSGGFSRRGDPSKAKEEHVLTENQKQFAEENHKLICWAAKRINRDFPVISAKLGYDGIADVCSMYFVAAVRTWKPELGNFSTHFYAGCRWQCHSHAKREDRLVHIPAHFFDSGDLDDKPFVHLFSETEQKYNRNEHLNVADRIRTHGIDAKLDLQFLMRGVGRRYRKVLTLYMQGYSKTEIAENLGVCKERARQILNQAIEKIRKKHGIVVQESEVN